MEQLLQITTIPVEFELKIKHARLEYRTADAEFEISRNDTGNFKVKGRPVRLNMDSFQFDGPQVRVNPADSTQAQANPTTYRATGQSINQGKLLINAVMAPGILSGSNSAVSSSIQQPAASTMMDSSEFTMRYEMDKLNFDLRSSHGNVEFIPSDIEMVITQYPDVIIEYIGEPLYVPPSVAEHFKVKA